MRTENCPICNSPSGADDVYDDKDNSQIDYIICSRCGAYYISRMAEDILQAAFELDKHRIDHYASVGDELRKHDIRTSLIVEVAKKAADGKGTDIARSIVSHVVRKNAGRKPAKLTMRSL